MVNPLNRFRLANDGLLELSIVVVIVFTPGSNTAITADFSVRGYFLAFTFCLQLFPLDRYKTSTKLFRYKSGA